MSTIIFNREFLEHIAIELDCDVSTIEKAIASFGETPVPKQVKPTRKKVPAKALDKASEKPKSTVKPPDPVSDDESEEEDDASHDDSKHTCDRIPRGKTDACGKIAKNRFEGEDGSVNWYCGTDKNGCYKSILLGQNRQKKVVASKPEPVKKPAPSVTKSSAPKPDTNAGRKKSSDTKTKSLIHQVTKYQDLEVKKIKVGDKVLWVNPHSRVLFDRGTREAYAVLGKDNKTVEPLTDENIRWLEASNISIRMEETGKKADLKKKLSKKAADDVDDDEELSKLQENIEDADTGGDDDIDLDTGDDDLGSGEEDESEDIDLGSDNDD